MVLPAEGTLLKLTGTGIHGVSLYSSRGLKQTYAPIQGASVVRRTINMEARNLALSSAKKWSTTISASDVAPPAFDAVFPGMLVTIECVEEMSYKTAGGSPSRTVASGSSRVEGNFTRYRPVLNCIIIDLSMGAEEWTAGKEWQLVAEEV